MVRVIASRTASAPWPASAGPFFARGASPWPARRGRCSSIVKRVVRSTSVPIAELPRPRMRSPSQCPGTARSAASAGRWLIMISGETKPLPRLRTRALGIRNTRPVRKQAVSSRRSAPRPWTNKRLIDGFVADAHRLVVREVDRQAPGNLLRAPCPGPSPILSLAMPAALPRHGGTGNGNAARSDDDASQSLLHIGAQSRVERKLGRLGAASRSLGMPLGSRRAILQPAAAGGCVAPQLTGDRRGGSTEPAPNLLHGMALHPEKRDLLALHQREIPPGERLCRGSEHRWWHAACLSEPSGSYRLRHAGFDRSILAAHPCRDRQPESALFIAPRHRRPTR